jgi:hypothetical protein
VELCSDFPEIERYPVRFVRRRGALDDSRPSRDVDASLRDFNRI